jgi:beta-glucosidase-like glycosyl hydrolase
MVVLPLLAISAAAAPPPPAFGALLTCASAGLKAEPFCDRSLPVSERVADLLPRLSLEEKIGQTGMVATAVERLAMIQYNFGGEALHGVWASCVRDNVSTPTHPASGKLLCPTQFPSPKHMSSSFDRDLWQQMADVTSTEARALYAENRRRHGGAAGGFGSPCSRSLEGCIGLSYYTPNVNLARDPRWGRIEECPGECPYLNSVYADAFTRGFQEGYSNETRASSAYLKASVTVKHFAAYNVEIDLESTEPEKWCGSPLNKGGRCALPNTRHSFNAHVSRQDLIETYVPPFEAASNAKAGAIMCSYNAVNGEPMCTNRELVGGLLRDSFGFEGVVATDCGALRDASQHHRRYADDAATATAAVRAGVDSNCGSVFPRALPWAFGNGTLNERELDGPVSRLLTARFRLGLFDEHDPAAGVPSVEIADVDSAAHRAVALQAARKGVILLQNNNNSHSRSKARLPLDRGSLKSVAMVGPNANASMNLLSGYSAHEAPLLVSPLSAMRKVWGARAVTYSLGANVSTVDNHGNATPPEVVAAAITAAVATAKAADITVMGLGLCGDNYGGGPPLEDMSCFRVSEAEGTDRSNLTLPGAQMALFRAVHALGKPLVVFVMNAGPLDLTEIKASGVPIVGAGYGGEFGGQALADVINGDYNPGGATTTTWYPEEFIQLASFQDMGMRPNKTTGNPGRTYRFLDTNIVKPVFPFGYGLSYTTFKLSFALAPSSAAPGETIAMILKLSNTGKISGNIAVLCYVSAPATQTAVKSPPIRQLFDFERIEGLAAGASTLVSMTLSPRGRGLVAEQGVWQYPVGQYSVQCEAAAVAKTAVATLTVQ